MLGNSESAQIRRELEAGSGLDKGVVEAQLKEEARRAQAVEDISLTWQIHASEER